MKELLKQTAKEQRAALLNKEISAVDIVNAEYERIEEVDGKLFNIMKNIFLNADETAKEFGVPGNLVLGANIAGFTKVANAMLEQGLV